MSSQFTISQSLIKELQKPDHCPRQIMYSFIEGKELFEHSDAMKIGRYFETKLLGSCRGGDIQEATLLKNGEKAKAYSDTDRLVVFAKSVFKNLGITLEDAPTQVQLSKDGISGNIDLVSNDIVNKKRAAIYDIKWTGTQEDDRWNGWADPESKYDAHLQAAHYVLLYHAIHGVYPPFYFIIFGKDHWVKVLKVNITPEYIEAHRNIIAYCASTMKQYADDGYKGKGTFNKCIACPLYADCTDRATIPEIQSITI